MDKRRILLIGPPNLLRDSLENILSNLDDVEMTGCLPLDDQALVGCAEQPHDLVLIADDQSSAHQASAVLSSLLEAYPNQPVIRVKLEPNVLVCYYPESLPASVADLIKVIHQAPLSGG
jgi:hypothetical protein